MRIFVITPKKVVNLFFLSALLPYVSIIPLGSDVQVITGLLAYFFLVLLVLRDDLLFDRRELIILALCALFLAHINFSEETYQLRKAVGPLYAFGIFYLSKRYHYLFDRRIVFLAISLYLFGAIVQLISPGLFELTLERFIRVSKYSEGGFKGVTSLTTEPGFLGFISNYLILILGAVNQNRPRGFLYYLFIVCCGILVLLSKSGTGYVVFLLIILYNLKSIILKYWFRLSLAFVLLITILSITSVRINTANKGLHELEQLSRVTSPKTLLQIGSVALRINPILVGWHGFLKNPLGNGSGSFTTQAVDVYFDNDLDNLYPEISFLQARLVKEISTDSVSTFGKYSFEYGIFFFVYLLVVFSGIDYKRISLLVLVILILSFLFSLPIVYPPLWIMIGMFDRYANKLPKK